MANDQTTFRCGHITWLHDIPRKGMIHNLRCEAPRLRDMHFCVPHQREADARVAAAMEVIRG